MRSSGGAEAARLRREIDRGRTGDKISWPDPATAPLGTDDEAAGADLSASRAERALDRERSASPKAVRDATVSRWKLGPAVWLYVLFIVLLAIVFGWGAASSQ